MPIAIPPGYTPVPTAPNRKRPSTFSDEMDAFLAAIAQLQVDLNGQAQATYTNALYAQDRATFADTRASYAYDQAQIAMGASNTSVSASQSATQSAFDASQSKVTAGEARDASIQARDLSQNYAQQASGTVGSSGLKSALQYAAEAKTFRDQAAAIVGPQSWTTLQDRPQQLIVSDPERQTRTASFTAVAGATYSVDTTAGIVDIQFPAPAANTDVAPIKVYDVTKKFGTNVARALPGSGHKIDGVAEAFRMDLPGRLYQYSWFPHLSNWSVQ